MVRRGAVTTGPAVNELGVYGLFLGDGVTVTMNEVGGHLLRTKVGGGEVLASRGVCVCVCVCVMITVATVSWGIVAVTKALSPCCDL